MIGHGRQNDETRRAVVHGGGWNNPHDLSLCRSRPIRGELHGGNEAAALGVRVRGYAPAIELCRELVTIGVDPSTPMVIFRDAIAALNIRTIGAAAQLAVDDDKSGRPRFRRRVAAGVVAAPMHGRLT